MGRITRIFALTAALSAPAAWSQPADSLRTPTPGIGSSGGVASGWQYVGQRRRTVQASGAAVVGLLLVAVAASSIRR